MKQQTGRKKNWAVAAAFAEAGEWETAREMVPEGTPSPEVTWLQRVFAAISFAEAGLHAEAVALMGSPARRQSFEPEGLEELGLKGTYMTFGIVQFDENSLAGA